VPLLVGIDEAGYGPTLGPLVVAASLWRTGPERLRADGWQLLRECVVRKATRGQWRLAVNDSKSVFDRKRGLHTLERAVLAFARCAGLDCSRLDRLLDGLGARVGDDCPLGWYRELECQLPLEAASGRVEAVAGRLERTMRSARMVCQRLRAELLTEDRFNRRIAQTRNKAAVLAELVLRLIDRAGRAAGEQTLVVRVDRLGGRTDYARLLRQAFEDRELTELELCAQYSRYRLSGAGGDWFIEFAVDADRQHLPVALASMTAKYVREALMQRFNRWWARRVDGVRPTAGYYTDAQRFLEDVESHIEPAGLKREWFVRAR